MGKYRGIHHVAMATRNLDGTLRFWRDLLGMRLVVGLGRPGARQYFLEIAAGSYITFFEWPAVEPVPEKDHGHPVAGPLIFDHVSFELDDEESLWELKDRVEAAGFWVSDVIDHGFIHSIYAFDPNGIPVEFSCPQAEVNVGKRPVMMDSSPSDITLEGPEPCPDRWPAVERITPAQERFVFPGEGKELVLKGKRNWWGKA